MYGGGHWAIDCVTVASVQEHLELSDDLEDLAALCLRVFFCV